MTTQLHEVLSVRHDLGGAYIVQAEITDAQGWRGVTDYVLTPGDTFGLAPAMRAAVNKWVEAGWLVLPYVPPTVEDIRAAMPALSPRQVRLGLLSIGITEGMVEDALGGDPEALIEWQWGTQIERLHPLTVALGEAFELPPEQIDTLWLWAAEL